MAGSEDQHRMSSSTERGAAQREEQRRERNSKERGSARRYFFPVPEQRLQMEIPITPEFRTFVTGYGKTKSY
jgi:hypothetical protein